MSGSVSTLRRARLVFVAAVGAIRVFEARENRRDRRRGQHLDLPVGVLEANEDHGGVELRFARLELEPDPIERALHLIALRDVEGEIEPEQEEQQEEEQ